MQGRPGDASTGTAAHTFTPHAKHSGKIGHLRRARDYARVLGFEFCLQGRTHAVQDAQLNTPGKLLADGGYRR